MSNGGRGIVVRAAAAVDLPAIGRLGALGRKLLDAAMAALEVRGAPRVVLSTAERNEPAQRLFAKAGFRRTMIEMTRELSPAGVTETE